MFSFWQKKNKEHFDYSLLGADMHSHLIPGIDDGSPDIETSLVLIKGMVDAGYKKLITTPHILWDMYQNTREDILLKFEVLKEKIKEEGLEVELGVGAEYYLDDYVKELLKKKEPLLTITKNLVLVEFSLASEPIDLTDILFELQVQGYQPVIAHPERYIYNERNKYFFEVLKSSGLLFQLNILSLSGFYGKAVQEMANYFLKNEFYELAGTDLHNQHHLEALANPVLNASLKKLVDSGKLINADL